MPRPRYGENEKTALDRIEDAFWGALRKGPYEQITVAAIVREAGVNRNTFYYHYRDIDDMSQHIVRERLLDPLIPQLVMRFVQHDEPSLEDIVAQPSFIARVERIQLIAGENSPVQLRSMLKDTVLRIWCEQMAIDQSSIDAVGELLLEFTVAGMLAALATWPLGEQGLEANIFRDSRIQTLIRQNIERLSSLSNGS